MKHNRLIALISVFTLAISLSACGETNSKNPTPNKSSSQTTTASSKLDLGGNIELTGAGATFPSPLYQTWFAELNKKYPNLKVNYQPVGSGAGVEQFTKGTVDFGASDVAMKDEEIQNINKKYNNRS